MSDISILIKIMGQDNSHFGYGSNYGSSWNGSLGDKSKYPTFGEAFKAAHAQGGSGHTFAYNGKLFSTNCADGKDYRKEQDRRENDNHFVRGVFHDVNATRKENGQKSLDWITGRSYTWSAEVDRQRSDYHRREIWKNNK